MKHATRVLAAWLLVATASAADFTYTINKGDGTRDRTYDVHVPSRVSTSPPVVLLFHGGGSTPALVRWESKFDQVSDAEGFLLVCPHGTNLSDPTRDDVLTWSDGRLLNNGKPNPTNDVLFVRNLLDDLYRLRRFDRRRVYGAGYSNGAQFSYLLAKQSPQVVAAIGCVAGHRGPDELVKHAGPMPLIQFSGKKDKIAPYGGGAPDFDDAFVTVLQPVLDTTAAWSKVNGCTSVPLIRNYGNASLSTYRGANQVNLWTLKDGGHTWPDGRAEPSLADRLGPVNRDVFAAQAMWDFFEFRSLPR